MQYPLVCIVILFCLGIIAANALRVSFTVIYTLSALSLVFSVLFRRKHLLFKIFLSCLVFFLGMVWLKNQLILPKAHIARRIYFKADNHCVLKGFINSPPEFKLGRTVFTVEAEEARFTRKNYHVCGSVYAAAQGRIKLSYGDRLILEGKLYRPYPRRGGRQSFLASRGIFAVIKVEDPVFVRVTGSGGGSPILRFALRMKDKTEALINEYTPQPAGAVLEAMLVGEKRNIPFMLYRSMMQTGTVHILVVSGFNTSLVIFCVFLLLKLARLPRLLRLLFALPILFFYCLMAGASAPVVRATVMSVALMCAYLAKRATVMYNSCALAALFIFLFDPRQLFDVGCQLSFVSVISMGFFYPKIRSLLRADAIKPAWIRFFSEGFLVSLSAWLGTGFLIAYYFRIISPVAVIANIFIVPLSALITLCGVSLLGAALVLPAVAPAFASCAQALVAVLIRINAFFLHLPGACFFLS